jgi:hypothetical protein
MRYLGLISLLVFSLAAQAGQTLRVDQQVLTVGDTAAHAVTLLGTPAFKEPVENEFGAYLGERWQYTRENGHVVIVTIIGGKVADIDDRQR